MRARWALAVEENLLRKTVPRGMIGMVSGESH